MPSRFFTMCMKENYFSLAREVWTSPELVSSGMGVNLRNIRLKYLCLLYRNGLYEEVTETYDAINPDIRALDDTTIAIAALYKIGTDEAFKKVMRSTCYVLIVL